MRNLYRREWFEDYAYRDPRLSSRTWRYRQPQYDLPVMLIPRVLLPLVDYFPPALPKAAYVNWRRFCPSNSVRLS